MNKKLQSFIGQLKNVTLFNKLLITPSILFILILAISTLSIFSIISQKNNLSKFKSDVLEKQLKVDNLSANVSGNINSFFYLLLTNSNETDKDKIQRLKDETTTELTTLQADFDSLDKELRKEKQVKIADKLKVDFADYQSTCGNILATFEFDSVTASIFLSTASTQYQVVKDDLEKYKKELSTNGEHIYNGMVLYSNSVIFIFLIALLAVLAIGIIATLTVSNMITSPIQKIIKSIERDENNNIQIKTVDVTSNDEIGILATVLNDLTSQVKRFINGVTTSVNDISTSSVEMSDSSEQTATGTQQVAQNISQLASGAQDQAKSVNESLKNINNINKFIQEITTVIDDGSAQAKEASEKAHKSSDKAITAVKRMNEIKENSLEMTQTITELGDLGKEIEVIIELIKSIAGQTNLLALNAAIEAARAGEHGKGFAVVADEVKKLAGQSAVATNKITEMIKEIQSKTTQTVTGMSQSVEKIVTGVELVQGVEQDLQSLAISTEDNRKIMQSTVLEMKKLSTNSEQIVKMMEEISVVTEQTVATTESISSITEEQTASMQEISASAQSLANIVDNLKVELGKFNL